MTHYPYLARTVTHDNGRRKTVWYQLSADEYEVATFKRGPAPWNQGWTWVLDGERVVRKGRAPREDAPVSPKVVESDATQSAEVAPPGRDEPWREQQRADEEHYWRMKTLRGET